MKVFNSTLAAIGLAAFVFASCSDSNSDPGTSPAVNPADLTNVTLTAQNIDNSRISNYKNSTANARKFFMTRAGATNFTTAFPTENVPQEPENLTPRTSPSDLTNKAYAIASKKTLNYAGKTIDGATIFIHGGATFEYDQTTKMTNTTIVLLGSGKLNYTGTGEMVPAGNTVYCTDAKNVVAATGAIKINGNFFANFRGQSAETGKELLTGLGDIAEKTTAEKNKSITPTQDITFGPNAQVYINGSIRAVNLNIEDGANVYAVANLFNNGEANINGNLQLEDGFIKAPKLNVSGNLIVKAGVKVTDTFNVNDGANIEANYINVTNNTKDGDNKVVKGDATLNLKGTGKITIGNQNVITANNLVTDNASAGQITLSGDNSVAVIKAYKFTNTGNEKIIALSTPGTNSTFLLEFTENYNGTTQYNTFEDLDIAATYIDYAKTNQNKNIELVNQDHKKYGYKWVGDASQFTKQTKLDLVAAAEPVNDGQSATCIAPYGGKLYVAYHTYGNKAVGGNLEVASMNGKTLTIEQSLGSDKIDYNHLMIDGGYVYLAGSEQGNKANGVKGIGAFLGRVQLNGGSLGSNLEQYAINKMTNGIDANCVAKYNGNYVVATTKGFSVFDKDFNFDNYGTVEGKYAVVANNKLYALDLAKLTAYDNASFENGTEYAVGNVTPTDNKAVVAADGTDLYVCLGENGIAKVNTTTGEVSKFYTCPTFVPSKAEKGTDPIVKGRANGVAVDSKYVYVACGSYGLVVLDKATGNEVCHRKAYTEKSANFVAVDGENIYVAYGQSRVQVFKLTGTN